MISTGKSNKRMLCTHEPKHIHGVRNETVENTCQINNDYCNEAEITESNSEQLVGETSNPISYLSTLPRTFFHAFLTK